MSGDTQDGGGRNRSESDAAAAVLVATYFALKVPSIPSL